MTEYTTQYQLLKHEVAILFKFQHALLVIQCYKQQTV